MARGKRHLLVRSNRIACGLGAARFTTWSPREVTCMKCRRTPHMADAEVKELLGVEQRNSSASEQKGRP